MKLIIQRVKEAQVRVEGEAVGSIGPGMLVFLGVSHEDTSKEADYLVNKIIQLRIFEDNNGKMNNSALEAGAEFLIISQFTLYGDCRKGRRPSFDKAASPEKAEELYQYFIDTLKKHQVKVESGRFGAMMDVSLINDGPVTFILECRGGAGLRP